MNLGRIQIIGIGNIFMGDDAFGCEVVQRLLQRTWPERVRIVDYGIRGLDVAWALLDGYGLNILIDAMPRGGRPGDLYLVEPNLNAEDDLQPSAVVEGHSMTPDKVLRLVQSLGGQVERTLIVGCEPTALVSPAEGHMGLSSEVAAGVEQAVKVIERLVQKFLSHCGIGVTAFTND